MLVEHFQKFSTASKNDTCTWETTLVSVDLHVHLDELLAAVSKLWSTQYELRLGWLGWCSLNMAKYCSACGRDVPKFCVGAKYQKTSKNDTKPMPNI